MSPNHLGLMPRRVFHRPFLQGTDGVKLLFISILVGNTEITNRCIDSELVVTESG
jgi:hypothetical protein